MPDPKIEDRHLEGAQRCCADVPWGDEILLSRSLARALAAAEERGRREEREACAMTAGCFRFEPADGWGYRQGRAAAASMIANAIRARGEEGSDE